MTALSFPLITLAQLSGTYTVGGSSPNFPNLDSAFNYMEKKGVTGKVRLNVRGGIHTLRTTITSISGVSSTKTIKVAPDPSNTVPVIFKNINTNSTTNFLVNVKQGFIEFDSFTFQLDSASTFGTIFTFTATCSDIILNTCKFIGKDTTSASANFAIITVPSINRVDYIKILNCTFYNGSIAINFIAGSGSGYGYKNEIKFNKFYNYYHTAIYMSIQLWPVIHGNYMMDINKFGGARGLNLQNCDYVIISENQININGQSGTGLILTGCSGFGNGPCRVMNNFISGYDSSKSGAFTGLFIDNCWKAQIYSNSVVTFNKSPASKAAEFSQGNYMQDPAVIKNNNFIHAGGGYAVYYTINPTLGIAESDYNNLYAEGSKLSYYNGKDIFDIKSLSKATLMDTHSISQPVVFKSNQDLHTFNIDLNASGIPISGITTDIDGQIRNATKPDIGADEFNPPRLDLAIKKIETDYCNGTKDIKLWIKNMGFTTITQAGIKWQISKNGGAFSSPQTYSFSGSLISGKDTLLRLGTFAFSTGSKYAIKAWLNSPNNQIDSFQSNDTLKTKEFKIAMQGVYTIGGTSYDFPSIDSAFNTLEREGICAPVRLHLRAGTYTEQTTINTIPGTNSVNTIKLVSDPANSSLPVIKYSSSQNNNWVIRFQNTSYINIDSINILATGTSYGRVIVFSGNNNHLSLNHDSIAGVRYSNSALSDLAVIFDIETSGNRNDYLSIRNCKIQNGTIGVSIGGNNIANKENGTVISGNKIRDFSYQGIVSNFQDSIKITNNYIHDNNFNSSPFGIRVVSNDFCVISGNWINIGGTVNPCGIYTGSSIGNVFNPSIFANNSISLYNQSSSGQAIGINNSSGQFNRIVFNSVNILGGDTSATAYYCNLNSTSSAIVLNNNFSNSGKGFASTFFAVSGLTKCDYNNYFAKGKYLIFYGGPRKTLSELKLFSLNDSNSLSIKPAYNSIFDLTPRQISLNGKAVYLSYIPMDLENKSRNMSFPDIGAYEFTPFKKDIELIKILTNKIPTECGIDSTEISVLVKNNGTDTIRNFNIKTAVSSSNSQQYAFTDTCNKSLPSSVTDTFMLKKFRTTEGGKFELKVFLDSADSDKSNDSASGATGFISSSPTKPVEHLDTICDNVTHSLITGIPAQSFLKWYSKRKGGSLIAKTDTLIVSQIKKDSSMYVSAVYEHPIPGILTTLNTQGGASCSSGGLMFNLRPNREMNIDSFTSLFNYTGAQNVLVYIKKGTYQGYATNASSWTFMDTGKAAPKTKNDGKFYSIRLKKPIRLEKDSLYGIYLFYEGDYTFTGGPHDTFYSNELLLMSGSGSCGQFGNSTLGRVFNGQVFYTAFKYCESERAKYTLKVNKAPIINIGKDTAYCSKNGMNLLLDPGPGYYSYLWTGGDTTQTIYAKDGGKYAVTVSNTLCKTTDEINITKNINPIINFGPDINYCANLGVSALLDPGAGYKSYQWSNGSKAKNIKATSPGTYSVLVIDNKDCPGGDTIQVIKINNPKPNVGKDTFYCHLDGLNLLLDAGPGYKKYNWSNTDTAQTSLISSKNKYIVSVEDFYGCIGKDTINIIEKTSPSVMLPKDTFYCQGNTIFLNLEAGSGHADYLWSTSQKTEDIFVNTKGVYSVVVTGTNGCLGSDSIVVSEISVPVNLGTDTGYCAGKVFSIVLDAGLGYSSYKWSITGAGQTINVQTKGQYSVSVVNNKGCKGADTIEISEITTKVNLGKDTSYCANSGMDLKLDAGTGFLQYDWSNAAKTQSISAKDGGLFGVIVTGKFGCRGGDSLLITKNNNPVVNLGGDRILNPDLPVNETLDAGPGFKTYKWSNLAATQSISVTSTGYYSVIVTDNKGCDGIDTVQVRLWNKTDLSPADLTHVKIYPNPASQSVQILSDDILENLQVITITGQEVYQWHPNQKNVNIDTSDWRDGVYILKYMANGISWQVRLIINH